MATKNTIAREIAKECGLSIAQTERVLTSTFNLIKAEVARGEKVAINDFGTFIAADKKATTAVNPQTKEKIDVPAKVVPRFKASSVFKNEVACSAYAKSKVKTASKKKK